MGMSERLKEAFGCIEAGRDLKQNTANYLETVRRQREENAHKALSGRRKMSLAAGVAGLFLLFFLGAGARQLLWVPVSYVSIDVNPSIELTLNQIDRVIAAEAYNSDGERILESVSVRGTYYMDAVELLMECELMQDYLTEDACLTFTVAAGNGGKEEALWEGIAYSSGCRKHGGLRIRADVNMVEEAHENGFSLGKYAACRALQEYDPAVTTEECHNMTMSEIHGLIEEHRHGGNHANGHKRVRDDCRDNGEDPGEDTQEEGVQEEGAQEEGCRGSHGHRRK